MSNLTVIFLKKIMHPSLYKRLCTIYELMLRIRYRKSERYWKQRYLKGGNSGEGSYNKMAQFKADVLNDFVKNNNINSIIEFGSGDGNQIQYFKNFKNYIGFDISEKCVQNCRKIYEKDSTKSFYTLNKKNLKKTKKGDLTLSIEVIFHLLEDKTFNEYMDRLFSFSNKYVIIFSSNKDEKTNAFHVKHRKFTDWIENNQKDWKLIKKRKNKYHQNCFSDFYFFEKKTNK